MSLPLKFALSVLPALFPLLFSRQLETQANFPPSAIVALVILFLAGGLWISEAIPLYVTSLLILFLAITWLSPNLPHPDLGSSPFLATFFSDITLLFLSGFVLSAALHKYQLDEQMARWIIRRTGTSYYRLLLGIMLVTATLSMFLSNTATTAMMLALVVPITHGLPTGHSARKSLVLCIPFAANAGGLGTPIGSPPNAIAIQYLQNLGLEISFTKWMLAGVPAVFLIVLVAWFTLMLLGPPTTTNLGKLPDEPLKLKWDLPLLIVIGGTALSVVGWLTQDLHGFSNGTIGLFAVILFFATGTLNVRDLRALSWDVLLLIGGGLCLGVILSESGLTDIILNQLPLEQPNFTTTAILFAIVACVMSSLMSNTATANLLMPLLAGLSLANQNILLLTVAFSCSLSMTLPVSTPPNALAFSTDEITATDLSQRGLIITIISLTFLLTLGFWWWKIIGLF